MKKTIWKLFHAWDNIQIIYAILHFFINIINSNTFSWAIEVRNFIR